MRSVVSSLALRQSSKSIIRQQNLSRALHTSPQDKSLIAATFGVAGAAFGASKLLEYYAAKKAAAAAAPPPSTDKDQQQQQQPGSSGGGWFGSLLSPGAFYQGGFEDTMTKREAALILGVRESATREKIREAHRHMSRANHPDTGGSAYLATKINEARDMLLNNK